ncbi:YceI family protein [Streptomyces sp. NPDC057702]|uniref:YceI family protein n=1 Tax=unclassified Streptomyces TaxID=2593676 RepID=UPI003677A86E
MPITSLNELTGDYVLDVAHTRIGFVARHTLSTRVRGRFGTFEGSAYVDGERPTRSTVRLVIQADDIQTRNRQRDDLVRAKFLDVPNHPTITFASTHILQSTASHYEVTGDLTLRGTTRPTLLTVELTDSDTDAQGNLWATFQGSATLNRKDWNINWNALTSATISPKVLVEFEATAIRRPA